MGWSSWVYKMQRLGNSTFRGIIFWRMRITIEKKTGTRPINSCGNKAFRRLALDVQVTKVESSIWFIINSRYWAKARLDIWYNLTLLFLYFEFVSKLWIIEWWNTMELSVFLNLIKLMGDKQTESKIIYVVKEKPLLNVSWIRVFFSRKKALFSLTSFFMFCIKAYDFFNKINFDICATMCVL